MKLFNNVLRGLRTKKNVRTPFIIDVRRLNFKQGSFIINDFFLKLLKLFETIELRSSSTHANAFRLNVLFFSVE